MKQIDFFLTRRRPDIIPFPKTAKGTDLMTDSPAAVEPKQLPELHLELKVAKKEQPRKG